MIQNSTFANRIETMAMKMLAFALMLLALALLLWAALVVLVQCVGWLKSGSWQGVSVGLLFVSQETHNFIQTSGIAPNAIEFVPSWGNAVSIEEVSAKTAGRMVGVQMICEWLFATPLVIWIILIALVLLPLSAEVERAKIFNSR
jgi:hypothetical protein